MTTCTARAPTAPGTTPTATTARRSTTTGRSGTQRAASPSPGHTLLSRVTSSVTLNTVTGRTSPCSRCAGPWCRWAACPRSRVSEDVRSPSSHVVPSTIPEVLSTCPRWSGCGACGAPGWRPTTSPWPSPSPTPAAPHSQTSASAATLILSQCLTFHISVCRLLDQLNELTCDLWMELSPIRLENAMVTNHPPSSPSISISIINMSNVHYAL